MEIKLGCLDKSDDPKDPRDYQLASILPEAINTPEEFMELKSKLSKVGYQNYGTCTNWGTISGIKEYQEGNDLSEYFGYINTKKISQLYDIEGDYVKNALKSVCDYGVCKAGLFPDNPGRNWAEYVRKEPSKEAYEDAAKRKGKTYWSVGSSIQDFKNAIFNYKAPVVFAMDWFRTYNTTPKSGRLPLPNDYVGGHCMAAIGWDKNGIWVKNSWGTGWGNGGFFYIPFEDWYKHNIFNCWILLDLDKNIMVDEAKLTQIYQEILMRVPDEGAKGYIGQEEEIVRGIVGSCEERKDLIALVNAARRV